MRRARPISVATFARVIGFLLVMSAFSTWSKAGTPGEPKWTEGQRQHWSLVPPVRPEVPTVKNGSWVRNSIDAFILSELEEINLAPAPEADRLTLLRRLRFDLTGLPPTPEEVDAFLSDSRPDAVERVVDRLLKSPQYGERWARNWLDLARFAESDGFKSDKTRPDAWRYRDWVIQALTDDMPYNRFLTLQLAGDEVAADDVRSFVATGFNRQWPFEDNNKVPGLSRQLMLEDITDTTASVFLGMTLACARCHNHKYDPISQRDYYRFQALFSAATPRDDAPLATPFAQAIHATTKAEHAARIARVRKVLRSIERPYLAVLLKDKLDKLPAEVREAFATEPEERSAFQEDLLKKFDKQISVEPSLMGSTMKGSDRRVWSELGGEMKQLVESLPPDLDVASGMTDTGPDSPAVHLLQKGNYAAPGDEVGPGFPSVFRGVLPPFEARPTSTTSGRRKALAEWLTRPDHPLTARVMVNRLWQSHFGRGIVATSSDFGTQGSSPSHPELLDWLATEFVARGWSLKAMHRLIVTSATYRQSSSPSAKTLSVDPENTLFSRFNRRRLEGEAVRDAMLAVSGLLDKRVGGPSVFPDLPPGIETRGGWTRSPSTADRNRRSIYVFVRRNLKYPLFDAFDAPDSNTTCAERNITVNAPQALMLLNSDLVMEQARALAGRVLASVPDPVDTRSLIQRATRLTLSRPPSSDELSRGRKFLRDQSELLSARAENPKTLDLPVPLPDGYSPTQAAALVDYCHVLLNLNEFVFVD
ncbi:MAG: PSD1 and planctomycete cytochrome C domain-containing protein [Isosphaeraceae bacterium]